MSISLRWVRGGVGGFLRLAAVPFFFALTQGAVGQEWDDVFEVAALTEPAPVAVQQPATVAADEGCAQWDAAEQKFDDEHCGCDQTYNCSPSFKARLEACMKDMEAQGIVYEIEVPQFYQGVADGGQDTGFEYGGKVDQFFIFDGCKLVGWDGFSVTMHVETRYGDDVNREAVGFAPVNVAMLYPKEDEHVTAITNLTLGQYLNDDWQVTAGKYNALDMFYAMYPQTGRGVNTFMNASMVIPLSVARVVPLSFMGVGLTKYYEKKPQISLLVFDNQNVATESGFDDMFDNGANILATYRIFTDVGGLPGSHTFGGIWATGQYVSFDPLSFVILPGEGVVVDRQSGAFSPIYVLEQTLWADGCNKNRNVGVFSQWGLSDEDTSPFSWSCNVALQGNGLNCNRPQDAVGVGYFHSQLSDPFVKSLSPAFDLSDVDGVELYYNAAVNKMFHLTADLQVVEPAEQDKDTALVVGLRGVIGL